MTGEGMNNTFLPRPVLSVAQPTNAQDTVTR